ncbi:MAG: hypothetical protein WBE91_03440 [Steroidobacteraceae bacterium]
MKRQCELLGLNWTGSTEGEHQRVSLHLKWLVQSRYSNQQAALKITALLNQPKASDGNLATVQDLVGACFSLWHAAFLADKTGVRAVVFKHASDFLDEMIAHNTIAYAQDRKSYEWTFNYYATNAARALHKLADTWPSIRTILLEPDEPTGGYTRPQRRWDRNHRALDEAIKCFERHLDLSKKKRKKKRKKK